MMPVAFHRLNGPQRLKVFLLLATVLFGALHAWIYRYDIRDLDGISYLDMGDAYFQGDWGTALNGYWSPLYGWLLGLARLALNPSPYWEYPVVQLVNLAIYLFALGCFSFLLRELVLYHRGRAGALSATGHAGLPEWAWPALGYPLFIWSSLYWIYSWLQCPDMCLTAFVYLAAGILLRIHRGAAGRPAFAALGVVLGLGYLTKAAMFPLAFVFLLVSLFAGAGWRGALPRVLTALAVFLLVAAPLIIALSAAKGRLTYGDTGRLNYAWFVNYVSYCHWPHWQGESPGDGTPAHPSRKLLDEPAVYEFRTPVGGTYPIWYDPSYWCEGMEARFDRAKQVWRLKASLRFYYDFFLSSPQCILLLGLLVPCLTGCRLGPNATALLRCWVLLVPAVAAMAMYALVRTETRYAGPFVVLLWLALYSGVRVPDRPGAKRWLAGAVIGLMLALLTAGAVATARDLRTSGDIPAGEWGAIEQWKVAEGLWGVGMRPGDEVGIIGHAQHASSWARLARIRITAELPVQEEQKFWEADPGVQRRVLEAFARAGVKAVVAQKGPEGGPAGGWQRIGDTKKYIYLLPDLGG